MIFLLIFRIITKIKNQVNPQIQLHMGKQTINLLPSQQPSPSYSHRPQIIRAPLIRKPNHKISQGTFASVHALNHKTIIKQIQIGNGSTNSRLRYAIAQKNMLDDCNHPVIIKCLHSSFIQNGNYGLQEQRGSKTLNQFIGKWRKYLARGDPYDSEQLDIKLLIYWMIQLIVGLVHLREKQILHRDIKLSNIIVCKNGQVRFIDFGISQYQHTNRFQKVRALKNIRLQNHIENFYYVGTCGYFAPEISLRILQSQYKTNYHRDRVRKYNYYINKVSLKKIMKQTNKSKQLTKEISRQELSSTSIIGLQAEQFLQNNLKISYQTEIWALGVVFYNVLYQVKPYSDKTEQYQFFKSMLTKEIFFIGLDNQAYDNIYAILCQVVNKHTNEKQLRSLIDEIPDIKIAIIVIRMMLEKDPSKRLKPQHLLKLLERYLDQAIQVAKLDPQYNLLKLCKLQNKEYISLQ